MAKMDKEKWIDGVVGSTTGMRPAVPGDALFHKIEQRLADSVAYVRTVPMRTVWLAAASILLLVAANLFLLKVDGAKTNVQEQHGVDAVIEYYGLNDDKMMVR